MSRVVAMGLRKPEGSPPVGTLERCPRCDAIIEVEPDEPHLAGVFEIGARPARAGWLICCGACNYSRVFIKMGKTKVKTKVTRGDGS